MDTSQLPHSKGPTQRKRINAVRRKRKSVDLSENEKVKARSGGRCEVEVRWRGPYWTAGAASVGHGVFHVDLRCVSRAVHVHHRMGGNGVRGRGKSALAENKLHVCAQCHTDIHARVLVPDGPAWRRVEKARRSAHAEAE